MVEEIKNLKGDLSSISQRRHAIGDGKIVIPTKT